MEEIKVKNRELIHKGKIIDLYFNTHKETVNWGRQQVNVYILKEQ